MKKIFLLLYLISPLALYAQCNGIDNLNPRSLPTGLAYYYELDANSTFANTDSLTSPTITTTVPSFDTFKANILPGLEADAKTFFSSEWGVSFTGANTTSDDGQWDISSQIIPLEYGQRIVLSGGETVPASGWTVYQAIYRIQANTDFAALTSGNWVSEKMLRPPNFPFIVVQEKTAIDYGVFTVFCTDGGSTTDFDIRYRSNEPIFPDIIAGNVNTYLGILKYPSNRVPVSYDLSHDDGSTWDGTARGRVEVEDLGGGSYQAITRILMKFVP